MTRIRIADDYSAIRQAMLALRPTAPAIVHAGNIMPVSAAHTDPDKFDVVVEHLLFPNVHPQPGVTFAPSVVNSLWRKRGDSGFILPKTEPGRIGAAPHYSGGRMTLAQINLWNALRHRTGLRMRAVMA